MNHPNIAYTKHHPNIASTIYESGVQIKPDQKTF